MPTDRLTVKRTFSITIPDTLNNKIEQLAQKHLRSKAQEITWLLLRIIELVEKDEIIDDNH